MQNGFSGLFVQPLGEANLNGASLVFATLDEAHLKRATLINANLGMAKLRGANLDSANLSGANLSGADLTYTRLFASVNGVRLSEAILHEASLNEADLNGAILSGAIVRSEQLTQAKNVASEQLAQVVSSKQASLQEAKTKLVMRIPPSQGRRSRPQRRRFQRSNPEQTFTTPTQPEINPDQTSQEAEHQQPEQDADASC